MAAASLLIVLNLQQARSRQLKRDPTQEDTAGSFHRITTLVSGFC